MIGAKLAKTPLLVGAKLLQFVSDPLDTTTTYRQLVGSLQYFSLTHPNIAFDVNQLY